jgi:carboxyl-terminal processing protease
LFVTGMLVGSGLTYGVGQVLDHGNGSTPTLKTTANGLPLSAKNAKKVAQAFALAKSDYYLGVKESTLVNGAINGVIGSLKDPYSVFMGAEEAKAFNQSVFQAQISGIGAEVTIQDGYFTVVAPIKGSPAEKAGVRAKDRILSVNGQKLDGLTLQQAVTKVRGKKGTEAKLEILRAGSTTPIEISVIRDNIDIQTIHAKYDAAQKIGKIDITQFSEKTGDDFLSELAKMEKQGMKGLIIDVRNNPGGSLETAIQILNPLVPKGKAMFKIEHKDGSVENQISQGPGKKYPIVILGNEGSASASEILTGALTESAGAKLVGTKTFGKGLVQSMFDSDVNDGSNYKITIAKWLTPKGNFINKKGIQPDVKVEEPKYYSTVSLPMNKTLAFDMLGEDVANLQVMLQGLGFHSGRTDGYFDYATKQAVKAAQRAYGLPVTGQVDKVTAGKLEEKMTELVADPKKDAQYQKAIQVLKKMM